MLIETATTLACRHGTFAGQVTTHHTRSSGRGGGVGAMVEDPWVFCGKNETRICETHFRVWHDQSVGLERRQNSRHEHDLLQTVFANKQTSLAPNLSESSETSQLFSSPKHIYWFQISHFSSIHNISNPPFSKWIRSNTPALNIPLSQKRTEPIASARRPLLPLHRLPFWWPSFGAAWRELSLHLAAAATALSSLISGFSFPIVL